MLGTNLLLWLALTGPVQSVAGNSRARYQFTAVASANRTCTECGWEQ